MAEAAPAAKPEHAGLPSNTQPEPTHIVAPDATSVDRFVLACLPRDKGSKAPWVDIFKQYVWLVCQASQPLPPSARPPSHALMGVGMACSSHAPKAKSGRGVARAVGVRGLIATVACGKRRSALRTKDK